MLPVGELEAGLAVVVLLRHDAVEADRAAARVREPRLPHAQAEAAPAQLRAHDVEAEEGEALIVVDGGDDGGGLALVLADEEAAGIDTGEAPVIAETRVPAFRRRPVQRKRDLVRAHRADVQFLARSAAHGTASESADASSEGAAIA